jgi:hypothetical protein
MRTRKNKRVKRGGMDDDGFQEQGPMDIGELNDENNNFNEMPRENLPNVNNEYNENEYNDEPMNINELNGEPMDEGQTDVESDMDGGKRKKKTRRINKKRTRKTMKKRNGRKNKKTKKNRKTGKKGGALYGTGVGANCYDPNFSIYNTRELTLFPYRPTK